MEQTKILRAVKIAIITGAVLLGGAAFAFFASNGFYIPCVFNKITGLLCPGCGNTRAALAVLRFDFAAAFKFNPLFFLEAFYIVWVWVVTSLRYINGKGFSYRPLSKIMDMCILTVIIIFSVVRNFF